MRADPDGIRQLIAELESTARGAPPAPPLPPIGYGGTPGGMSDDWKASVDSQLSRLHDDIRRLTGWIIAAVVAPFLAIIGLYAYTGSKFDAAEARAVGIERRLSAMEVEQAKITGKLDLIIDRKSNGRLPAN